MKNTIGLIMFILFVVAFFSAFVYITFSTYTTLVPALIVFGFFAYIITMTWCLES